PRFIVINKMDRENADFEKTYASVEAFALAANKRLVHVQLPGGEKLDFKGVIDLVHMKAYSGDGKISTDIPAEYNDTVTEARQVLLEAAAEGEDALLEKYLETGELSGDELLRGLKDVVMNG